ncbi:dihydrolipoamide acetyltransferase family protein [Parabacteroides pacaensis]|uniref:dihydrolipoamide acetyltransferase family protein n=1 Tax=Parabacteroides pacaensis TaxID=2086575 RepID=UPI000D108963|nr:dihydrolipoamide acetyltransferase family protein [Parabacteroides pacaensis]
MPTFEIKMPKLGESITEGTIVSWSVKVGDKVKEDDVLFEVTTAKVSAEVPSPVAGKITEILYQEGDTVPVGTTVAKIELSEEEEEATPENGSDSQPEDKGKESSETPISQDNQEKKEPSADQARESRQEVTPESNSENNKWYSPAVVQLAKEANISQAELEKISGTGYEGRVSKKDIQQYIADKNNRTERTQNKETAKQESAQQKTETAPPAKEQSKQAPSQERPAATSPATSATSPAIAVSEDDEVQEMDRVRRIIADHMVMSKKTSPHVTTFVEADVTKLVQWRSKMKDEFLKQEGISLTYMPVITAATAKALKEFPQINASVNGYQIILKKHINIGIAVSLPNGNLIVPVVQNADKLNIQGLASQIDILAKKARSNKLSPDNMSGGTFTITNFGTFKNLFATPIINQPEVAILGVGYIEKKPAVIETPEGDSIAIRHKMFLSLSYDHRIIDGALGGAFLKKIADFLEEWNG